MINIYQQFKKPPPLEIGDSKPQKRCFWAALLAPFQGGLFCGEYLKLKIGKDKKNV
jgi:hypothetical protein